MEIERKWLIDGFPAGLPLLKEARVRQGYISTAPVVRIRESVNADGCRCVLCFKGEGTLAREEVETDISAELFRRLTAFTGQVPHPAVRVWRRNRTRRFPPDLPRPL